MSVMSLAVKSLRNRSAAAILTVFSIAVSVTLLLGVERVRVEAKNSFTHTLSGTDLVVGARSGSLNLLLYSVFHIGDATNNITWETYEQLAADPAVDWTIPVSLGDSHKGYRVVGTNTTMFEEFRFGDAQLVGFANGKPFDRLYEAVVGSEVAAVLGYDLGEEVILSHGTGAATFHDHGDKPFRVVGVLKPTGTPMDKSIMVSLEGIEALHIDWFNGVPPQMAASVSAGQAEAMELQPQSITAYFVGLKSRAAAFRYQRYINDFREEALSAILPGVALMELWQLVGTAEKALMVVSGLVVIAGMLGMLTTILTSLNERRREMAILRSVGARPSHIFGLMMTESLIYAVAGTALGFVMLYGLLFAIQPLALRYTGLHIAVGAPGLFEIILAGIVLFSALVLGAIPAWRAYQNSLSDGLTVRV
ncbi:peptide ABC transporter permease [Endozoicomonas sp. (ex Bugula neritina AB1)]|nr:peptide ABC transporter permease [Endozoicomonas sp. (ex Bugula neritina AB1)]